MIKRFFWPLFRDAWQISFTSKNIKKAFEKSGIWPQNPQKTPIPLQKSELQPATSTRLPALPIKTPIICHRLHQLLKKSSLTQKYEILGCTVIRLATNFEIQKHENNSL